MYEDFYEKTTLYLEADSKDVHTITLLLRIT